MSSATAQQTAARPHLATETLPNFRDISISETGQKNCVRLCLIRPSKGDSDVQRLESAKVVRFGSFEADLITERLKKHGVRLRLPGESFQLLAIRSIVA